MVMAVRKPRPPRLTANSGISAADGAGGGEQRAVAAQHDHQVAAFGNLGARHAGAAARSGGLLVAAHGDAALVQPLEQPGTTTRRLPANSAWNKCRRY
jgi:hypothetical protein